MIGVKNLICYFRSISHLDSGEFTTPEGSKIKYDSCFKLEVDLIDNETGRPATRIFRIKDNTVGNELATQLQITPVMTKLSLDVDIVLSKQNNAKIWVLRCFNEAFQKETDTNKK